MRQFIRQFGFWYGCLASIAALAWNAAALLGHPSLPEKTWSIEALFALHAFAVIVTLQKESIRHPWEPYVRSSPGRIFAAKVLLGICLANFFIWLIVLLVGVSRKSSATTEYAVPLIVTSFFLLNTVYIGLHWALRPENVLSRKMVELLRNPAVFFFIRAKRKSR